MFSTIVDRLRRTSAWRLSAPSTVAFALGTAIAFLIVYQVVERGIRQRSDAWLVGESELLAQVAGNTPAGEMHERMMEEVAELARHEVLPVPGTSSSEELPVFFVTLDDQGEPDVWVGPGGRSRFTEAIQGRQYVEGVPWSLTISGWDDPFRVVAHASTDGGTVFLGFIDQNALALLHRVALTFSWMWVAMLLLGLASSCLAARGILRRVERITDTAAAIGSEGLDRRMPEGGGDDEITRLSRTFNKMLDRIKDSVDQIRTVADAVAHDLRSPLTSIRGNLEMAVTRGETAELQEAAAGAIEGLDGLLRTLTTSLDLAEAGAGALRLHRKTVDLGQMAREMVELYHAAGEERGLIFEIDEQSGTTAEVDPDLAHRALANLLDNAIEHLPEGCRVRVTAEVKGRMACLSVADDGPGFPPELRGDVFERWAKGPSSGGFGIGLALVRSVARAHGGDAEIVDRPGGGVIVRLSFLRTAAANKI